jgi:hypothetical protein
MRRHVGGAIRWTEPVPFSWPMIVGTLAAALVAVSLTCLQLGCIAANQGRQGTVEQQHQAAASQPVDSPVQAGIVNLAARLEAVASVQTAVRAEISGARADIAQARTDVRAGRDALTSIRTNTPWPYVAMVALLAPSPVWGQICRWRRRMKRGRSPP